MRTIFNLILLLILMPIVIIKEVWTIIMPDDGLNVKDTINGVREEIANIRDAVQDVNADINSEPTTKEV